MTGNMLIRRAPIRGDHTDAHAVGDIHPDLAWHVAASLNQRGDGYVYWVASPAIQPRPSEAEPA